MLLTRYEFELLAYIEKHGRKNYSIREISDNLCISGSEITKCIDKLSTSGCLDVQDGCIAITQAGMGSLEPYRVRRAIILAAGFGSRMMPATADRPKPMVTVNGIRILDTLLNALVAVGITDIAVVGGYHYDKLEELLDKYPFLRLIENREYNKTNNISSAMLALDQLHDGCYFCEADLFITNPNVITKYQYASNILGSYSMETDGWSFKMVDGYLDDYKKGMKKRRRAI